MLEQRVSLASNGVVKVPGYEQLLHFGYTKNRGVYRIAVTATGEWDGLAIRAFWHVPDGFDPASSLVADGYVDVPASVTAQSGNGCITFEGSDGTKTVTSADLRYRVSANSGTEDGTMPEPGTPAWQEFIDKYLTGGGSGGTVSLKIGTVTSGDTASASIVGGKLNLVLPRGEKGEQGSKGDTGAVGPQGPEGPKGAAGERGAQGPKGETGAAGAQGEQGPKGDTGERGAQGPAGTTPTLEIGMVTTGAKAAAAIQNGKLNLVLPRGEKGEKGEQGPEGDTGPAGPQGPEGPKGAAGAQGEQGPKGGTGPAGPGFTDTAKQLVATLFAGAAYSSAGMKSTLQSLCTEWGIEMPDVPDSPTKPDAPSTPVTVPGETAVYELTTPTVFKTAEKKYIDTGVKLFEDISAQPTWTILLDSTDFASLKGLASSAALFHCGTSDDSNLRVIAWSNGGVYFNLYGVDTNLGWWVGSSSSYLRMCLQIRGNQYKLSYDTTEGSWTDIPNYSANIDATLLLGAYREDNGTIGRFWEGNLNKFAVYNKLLTDEQIKTFMEAK